MLRAANGRGRVTSNIPKTSDATENELVTSCLVAVAESRDVAALRKIFTLYSPRIRAYLIKHTRDVQAAEDLVQEVMLAIWRKAEQFDPMRGSAAAWIFAIARNTYIDAWRRKKRPEFDLNDPALMADPEPEPTDILVQRQRQDAVQKAMQTLPQEQIDLIKLSFFEEASHSTIAKQLSLPIGTVKSRIRLAFGRLRTALEDLK
ncbi:sigma-70 family RNA polymerase sigma factor [Devosia sp. MC532]|nr:sigma-70 family RNA polymerase sigma factor [Devosia sp. MC532]